MIKSSKQIEEVIQKLIKKKERAIERENRYRISEPTILRINEVLKAKNIELTQGEMDHIVEPLRKMENFFQKKNTKATKKDT